VQIDKGSSDPYMIKKSPQKAIVFWWDSHLQYDKNWA
jgi:hypothetical protein